MYRDLAQWLTIRHRVLKADVSQRQVARETGISPKTISKMLVHRYPQPYGPRSHRYPKLRSHIASIRRMLEENASLPPSARLSVRAMYERIRREEGFSGGYSTVGDYVRAKPDDAGCIWEYAYNLLVSLEKTRAIDFLFLLSRANPPVISKVRTEQFFRDARKVICITPKPDARAQTQRAALEWMRAVLQGEVGVNALRRELGEIPGLVDLLKRLYDGRLSDRNRAMVVLTSRRGLSGRQTCAFLGIDRKSYKKYLRVFENGGVAALFKRQTKSTRKFDDEAVKKAVFSILHEPPSNYGINRTRMVKKFVTSFGPRQGCLSR